MKTRLLLRFACCLLAFSCAFPVFAEHRTISTFTCRPYGITKPADLLYRFDGVKNVSARKQYVVCPVIRENETSYLYFGPTMYISFYYMNDNAEGSAGALCTGYETDRALGIARTLTTESGGGAFAKSWDTGFTYTAYDYGGSGIKIDGQLNVRCSIDPGAVLYLLYANDTPYF